MATALNSEQVLENVDLGEGQKRWSEQLGSVADNGDLVQVKMMVRNRDSDLSLVFGSGGFTCLHEVCSKGHVQVVKFLVKAGGTKRFFSKQVKMEALVC